MSSPARRVGDDSGDADLVARMRAGDRGAVTELFDRFGRPAFTLARRILADDALAEDVLQQVFLGVWRDPGAYDRSRGSFSSWLLAVVHHGAVDAVRRGESQRRRPVRAEDDAGAAAPSSSRDAGGRRPAAQRVRAALGALPDDQREALALAYYGGYTQREVAALTRAPLGTVTSRMLAGMRRLAEELGGTSASSGGGAPIGGAGR